MIGLAGVLVVTSAVVIPVVLTMPKVITTQQRKAEAMEEAKQVEQNENQVYEMFYGSSPEKASLPPAKEGYEAPILEAEKTTYSEKSEVGAKGLQIAFFYKSKEQNRPDLIVVYKVAVKKAPEQVFDNTNSPESPTLTILYGTPLEEVNAPDPGEGYARVEIVVDGRTEYSPKSKVGQKGKIAFRYKPQNMNNPDKIVIYGFEVKRRQTIIVDLTGRKNSIIKIKAETQLEKIKPPVPPENYKGGTVLTEEKYTTYKPSAPIKTIGKIGFKYEPSDLNEPEKIVVYAFEVTKDPDSLVKTSATYPYNTPPDRVGKPGSRQGYEEPVLDTLRTTYKQNSRSSEKGLLVVWRMASKKKGDPDLVYEVLVNIKKQPDKEEIAPEVVVASGTPPAEVGKPSKRSGYTEAALIESRTTYSAQSPPKTSGLVVVWKMANENPDAADLVVSVPVKVTAKREQINVEVSLDLNEFPKDLPDLEKQDFNLPEQLEVGAKKTAYLNQVLQNNRDFLRKLKDEEKFTVIYELRDKKTKKIKKRVQVNFRLLILKPEIIFLRTSQRLKNSALPRPPEAPAGYRLVSTAYFASSSKQSVPLKTSQQSALNQNNDSSLQILWEFENKEKEKFYYSATYVTVKAIEANNSKALNGAVFTIPFGMKARFLKPKNTSECWWSDAEYTLEKPINKNQNNYSSKYSTENQKMKQGELGEVPANSIYAVHFASSLKTTERKIKIFVAKREYKTDEVKKTDSSYLFNLPPQLHPPKGLGYQGKNIFGLLQATIVDSSATVPGKFFIGQIIEDLHDLYALPPGTTVRITLSLEQLNDNAAIENGKTSFTFKLTVEENGALLTKSKEIQYLSQVKNLDIADAPKKPGYESPYLNTVYTTYDESYEPGQKGLYVFYTYIPHDKNQPKITIAYPVKIVKKKTTNKDYETFAYEDYRRGETAPTIDEKSTANHKQILIPEGHYINQAPTYIETKTHAAIPVEKIPELVLGTSFQAVYKTKIKRNYEGNSIEVRINYSVQPPNEGVYKIEPTKSIAKNHQLYQNKENEEVAIYYGDSVIQADGHSRLPRERQNKYESKGGESGHYWVLVQTVKLFAKTTTLQLFYVSKTETPGMIPASAPVLMVPRGIRIEFENFESIKVGPKISKQAIGAQTKYRINESGDPQNAPPGTVYSAQYQIGASNFEVSVLIDQKVINANRPKSEEKQIKKGSIPPDQISADSVGTNDGYGTFKAYRYIVEKSTENGDPGIFKTGMIIEYPAIISNAPFGTKISVSYKAYAVDQSYRASSIQEHFVNYLIE